MRGCMHMLISTGNRGILITPVPFPAIGYKEKVGIGNYGWPLTLVANESPEAYIRRYLYTYVTPPCLS